MIYDCFTYTGGPNEDALLRLRMEEMQSLNVIHVVVEADVTFTNKPKSFNFNGNNFPDHFAIKHIKVTDMPTGDNHRIRETHQRNAIMRALEWATNEDVVIISDLDEVPRASAIAQYDYRFGDCALVMDSMLFYLNVLATRQDLKAARIIPFNMLRNRTPQEVRASGCAIGMLDAGWHFTYMGGTDNILIKFQNICHQEEEIQKYANRELIDQRIRDLKGLLKESKLTPLGLHEVADYAKNLPHMIYERTN